MRRSLLVLATTAVLVVAACSGSGVASPDPGDDAAPGAITSPNSTASSSPPTSSDPVAGGSSATAPTISTPTIATAPDTVAATTTTIDPSVALTVEQMNDYVEQAASFDQASADAQFPVGLTFAAGGAPGYSRYVFRETSAGVVPTLVEGPIDDAVRCQDPDLPCSHLELKDLHAGGGEIPDGLELTPDDLGVLVGQLEELSAFALEHQDIDRACAEGFVSDRIQTPNMGTHLYNLEWIGDGFDPGRPEILLYALADDTVPDGPVGQCVDGVWNGEPMQLIGTSFLIPPQIIGNDHPDTFAGPLDNWHIHYNLCRGANAGRDSFLPITECQAAGGNFSAALGWMIHAWVDPAHDNDLGVFSMWNATVAPIGDASEIAASREVRGSDFPDGAAQSLISDFEYNGDLTVRPGQSLFFNNVDAVPHTVSAGTFENPMLDTFDSGVLPPGTNFELSFDEPGVYSLFCTLHPDMVATVQVEP